MIFSILFFIIAIFLGAFVYSNVEGWNYFNSIYFVVVTITTIGYGDLVPVTIAGKSLTMFFSFFGVAMALYFLSMISSEIFKKHIFTTKGEIKEKVKKTEKLNKLKKT